MKIHVRRRHIVGGLRCKMTECPIALAFQDATGKQGCVEANFISTTEKTVYLPRSAQRFIRRFDAGLPVKPFAFVLK